MQEDSGLKQALDAAIASHRRGELTAAEAGYQQVLSMDPQQPDALHLLGVLVHQLGDGKSGIELIVRSLEVNPDQPMALNNLGNIHAARAELEEAAGAYTRAIGLRSDYAQAYHNLGNVLSSLDRDDEAAASYRKALELNPADASTHMALAGLYEKLTRWSNAAAEYRAAIEHQPDSVAAYRRLGSILRKQGKLAEALAVYEQWLAFDSDNPVAQHFRAACAGSEVPQRASDGYVKQIFDGFAEDFDGCLAGLGYRVPELMGAALADHLGTPAARRFDILDAGCGTGLCARGLRPYAASLVGVDLSAPMLEQARARGGYDQLVQAELAAYLDGRNADFDVIVSGDTLVYIGDLRPVLRGAARALRAPGALLFSVEKLAGKAAQGYRLNRFGRYEHAEAYLREQLDEAGFDVRSVREDVLRTEGGAPVTGLLVLAVRAAPDDVARD